MQALFAEYGLTHTTGSFPRQVASASGKVIRQSLPNDLAATAKGLSRRTVVRLTA